uniref:Uncharacterized protein n=1 Tax=Babesia bovis TaxID=5865 RepID=A7AR20_BABBO|eukprot:XP_001610557.1 hypothetical protein [Babesia bovis T2Bo]
MAIEALKDDSEFALKCIFLVLIAYTGDVPVDVVNQMSKVIDTVRSTTKPALQLEMINIFCAMRNYHPQMHSQLEHRHRAYMEYLDEMGHYIRLSVPHEIEPTQIDSLRATLDSLNVKHYAGISGMLYPI